MNFYKTAIISRNSDPAFDIGKVKGVTQNNILAFSRTYDPTFYPTYVTLVNFNYENASADFSGIFSDAITTGVVYLSSQGTYAQG